MKMHNLYEGLDEQIQMFLGSKQRSFWIIQFCKTVQKEKT